MAVPMLREGTFIGRLFNDPEAPRVLNNGSAVTSFKVVCGRSKKDEAGQWVDDPATVWQDCKVFTKQGAAYNLVEIVTKYAKKGTIVYVRGELKTESWDDKTSGAKRSKLVLEVRDFQILSDGPGGNAGGERPQQAPQQRQQPQQSRAPQQPRQQAAPQRQSSPPPQDSEIPF